MQHQDKYQGVVSWIMICYYQMRVEVPLCFLMIETSLKNLHSTSNGTFLSMKQQQPAANMRAKSTTSAKMAQSTAFFNQKQIHTNNSNPSKRRTFIQIPTTLATHNGDPKPKQTDSLMQLLLLSRQTISTNQRSNKLSC